MLLFIPKLQPAGRLHGLPPGFLQLATAVPNDVHDFDSRGTLVANNTTQGSLTATAAIDTSLAVVAPGISEALVATAAGLAVAIPAVIFYNFYSNGVAEMETEMQSFSADFMNLIERDLISKV